MIDKKKHCIHVAQDGTMERGLMLDIKALLGSDEAIKEFTDLAVSQDAQGHSCFPQAMLKYLGIFPYPADTKMFLQSISLDRLTLNLVGPNNLKNDYFGLAWIYDGAGMTNLLNKLHDNIHELDKKLNPPPTRLYSLNELMRVDKKLADQLHPKEN